MTEILPPTQEELYEEDGLEEVDRHIDDSWRHGNNVTVVYRRSTDGTYWEVCYQESGNGEWHGIRENQYSIHQVEPVKKIIETIDYIRI